MKGANSYVSAATMDLLQGSCCTDSPMIFYCAVSSDTWRGGGTHGTMHCRSPQDRRLFHPSIPIMTGRESSDTYGGGAGVAMPCMIVVRKSTDPCGRINGGPRECGFTIYLVGGAHILAVLKRKPDLATAGAVSVSSLPSRNL